ncbi:hypothetical protein Lal_00037816 [Lupinus albus]|uniref:Uncharacterized protein n=1 Tax=Lupinus albus TaxID=3870 RepID=A0A6A4QX82_LUPAL|nr:hypothetical protein Lalb_Chr03g0041841 [Lupinus albus]KAF1895700.1 hypothetical protein Lal_00037816 [Lupinus albus]
MDIEPFWALGGWFFLSKCMALPKTSTPISESFSKSSTFLPILTLFFILLILVNLSHQPNPSTKPSFKPVKSSHQSTMSTTNLHPQKAKNTRKEFGVDAHEVPSGPNPISN